jgi:predicted RecB family nuclease
MSAELSYASKRETPRLSKSRFVAGVQCLKRLYWQVYQPELAGEIDEGQEARFEQGHEVGALARTAFPGGVLVDSNVSDLEAALKRTAALIDDPAVPAIFEATIRRSSVLVRVDILERRPRNRWRLIEVKSSVETKEHYIYDVAIQHHVVQGSGLNISSACLMHLNRDYVYDGQSYDPHGLFIIEDLTRGVRRLGSDLPRLLRAQQQALARNEPPNVEAGPQCHDPYECEFFGQCNPALPETHISVLPRLSEQRKQDLLGLGVNLIKQIPDDFPLTELQARVCTAVKTDRPWTSRTLAKELSRLTFPLYFMDFESLYPAIPRYAGMWPYSHIPFQWSVHRQLELGALSEPFEFLADDDNDPRQAFISSLIKALGNRGRIVVYNSTFESQRLRDLAGWLPQYAGKIDKIQDRLWDLWPFVKRHVYHPQFRGSFSLKAVLPALVDLSYEGMEVSHGDQAGLAWDRMIRGGVDASERQRLKLALLAYCCQDTLGMVRILEHLKTLTVRSQARGRTS